MEVDASIGKEVVRTSSAAIRPAPQHWRIKLYELEEQGAWIDKGTGFVHVKVVNELGGPALVIRSEENDGVIFFQSKVQTDDVYEIQGDNIIMWRETDANGGLGLDYALSFQESAGCTAIWDQIVKYQAQCLAQREHTFTRPEGAPSASAGQGPLDRGFGIGPILSILDLSRSPTNSSRSNSVSNSIGYTGNSAILVLPTDCDEENSLARIRYKLETLYPAQREFAISQLLDNDGAYINKLLNVFTKLETKQDVNSLKILAEIFRAILLLNDPALLEHLIATDEVFYRLSGVMEYDRTLQEQGHYREFLFRTARYREVVPLESAFDTNSQVADMRTGCTVLYRLRFVRDIMLHPKIDDPGITAIGSMISFSSSEICTMMLQNTGYISRVLKVIWPALHIEDYLPAPTASQLQAEQSGGGSLAPSSQTVSPALSPVHTLSEGLMDVVGVGAGASAGAGGADTSFTSTGSTESTDTDTAPLEDTVRSTRSDSSDTIEDDADFIGPTPSTACTTETVVTPPNTGGIGANTGVVGSQPTVPTVNPASRPIDGLRFLRELFAMSKFLSVEKRVELFHQLFEGLQQPLMLVINRVLVECRGGDSTTYGTSASSDSNNTASYKSANVSAMIVEDDVPRSGAGEEAGSSGASAFAGDALFLPEEQAVATQVIGEVLTALGLVCPSLLRQVVISSPVPAVNPLSSSSKATANSNSNSIAANGTGIQGGSGGSGSVSGRPAFPWWEHCTLFLCIDVIVNSPDSASIQSFGDVVKLVLDLEKAPSASVKNDNYKFLSYFYDHYLVWLLVPYLEHLDPSLPVPASYYSQLKVTPHKACALLGSTGDSAAGPAAAGAGSANVSATHQYQYPQQCSSAVHASRRNLMEIVIQCVTTHSYRFKYYAMRNSVLSKILSKSFQQRDGRGQASPWSWLHMLGIKFTKAVISVKDEFYYKHIEKLDLLRNMLTVYKEIAHKDNMVTASLLDVVEDIRNLGVKNLVVYIVSKYDSCFVSTNKVYERLKIKYDQIVDRSYNEEAGKGATNSILHPGGSKIKQQRKFRDFDSEEDYFFGEDDNIPHSSPHGLGGLGYGGSELSSDAGSVHSNADSHRDKRPRTDSHVSSVGSVASEFSQSSALSSIVRGAFVDAPSGGAGAGAGGNSRALNRTTSLGRDGVHNGVLSSSGNDSVNSSYISSSGANSNNNHSSSISSSISSDTCSTTSKSTTAGVRHSIMAMLGGYGDGDTEMDTDAAEGNCGGGGEVPPPPPVLNASSIKAATGSSPKSLAHKMNSYYTSNADLNIYDDEDLQGGRAERSNSADLSDCASSISSDDEGSVAEREEATRRMHSAGARYCDGFSIPAPVYTSSAADLYAGSDFVRASEGTSAEEAGLLQPQPQDLLHQRQAHQHQPTEDPLLDLPLPPLKPRFEYDEEEEHTFIHSNNNSHSNSHNSTSGHSGAANGGSSGTNGVSSLDAKGPGPAATGSTGHISFSFKKKPKL